MKRDEFEKLVIDALEDLPEFFKSKLKNVAVVIEDKPSREQIRTFDMDKREFILGLYQGVPLPDRTHLYGMVLPDKITIFQRNIERVCRDKAGIKEVVIRTVQHEIAHHFGISDRKLRDMGVY